jgi:hypothetical protein
MRFLPFCGGAFFLIFKEILCVLCDTFVLFVLNEFSRSFLQCNNFNEVGGLYDITLLSTEVVLFIGIRWK